MGSQIIVLVRFQTSDLDNNKWTKLWTILLENTITTPPDFRPSWEWVLVELKTRVGSKRLRALRSFAKQSRGMRNKLFPPENHVRRPDHNQQLRGWVGSRHFSQCFFFGWLYIHSQNANWKTESAKIKCFLRFSIATIWPDLKKNRHFYTWLK